MKSSLEDVRELFGRAVETLAVSTGSIQERVADAYMYDLIHLDAVALPPGVRAEFDEIERQLTEREPEGTEGRVMASVRDMGDEQAASIARKIFNLHLALGESADVDD